MASDLTAPTQIVQFGRRRGPPRACVLEHKPHVRGFLAGMLEELGFATRDCGAADFKRLLDEFAPDLVVFGPLNDRREVGLLLQALRFSAFAGRIMLFGGRHSSALMDMQDLGEHLGLAMLPPLGTPFRDGTLVDNVACFLPITAPADAPIDAEEALRNGWVELWYQPKIDPRSLTPHGAEAIVRVRHPNWGVISPANFIAPDTDPFFNTLSQFVIMRAMADSAAFAAARRPIDISVDLPAGALGDAGFSEVLQAIPAHVANRGLQVEVRCADLVGNLPRLRDLAGQLAARNIGLSIDDIGSEAISLSGQHDLPVVELKAGRDHVRGCADDRVKQAVCAQVVAAARNSGARAVAVGVEKRADYLAARALGFDLLQGPLFAKPIDVRKFERTLARASAIP
jgi:EAL domain-containing protein (putative c-di-GMP-specific phosphodiesterase class I)